MTTFRTRIAVIGTTAALAAAGVVATAVDATAATASTAAPRCGNASLAVTRTFTEGGGGHGWMSLIYRNASSRTCTVTGYPGLDAVSSSGHVLAHASRSLAGYGGSGTLHTVTVKPGGYASASVEWLNFNGSTGGACRFAASVNTIVANTTRVHRLAVAVSACGLQVHPTVAGTPGFPRYAAAQRDWIAGSKVAAAVTNKYLYAAEAQLKAGGIYPTQVKQIAQLASFPLTSLTKKQIAAAHADVKALDAFFATPGLYV